MRQYDGVINGDRLSPVLLYDITKPFGDDSSLFYPVGSIILGLNRPRKYQIAMKFYNPLTCPVSIDDIQLMMCPVYSSTGIKYYNDDVIHSVPASSLQIQVRAFTNVVEDNNTLVFKHAATSNLIPLSKLSYPNCCYEYVDGRSNPDSYYNPFGSVGVYWGDTHGRCLSPKKITFENLIVQAQSSCYFLFDAVAPSDSDGGFAIWGTEDFRAVNFNTVKSSGVLKRVNGKWEVAKIYKREGETWKSKFMPGYMRDDIEAFYPYEPNGTPDEPTPPTPPTPEVPDGIFDGTTWYVPVTVNNQPTYSYLVYGKNNQAVGENDIRVDKGKGPEFSIDLTNVKYLKFNTYLHAWNSIDGYSQATITIQVGSKAEKVTFYSASWGSGQTAESKQTLDIVVDTSDLSGVTDVSVTVGDYVGGGANLQSWRYNCHTETKLNRIEAGRN